MTNDDDNPGFFEKLKESSAKLKTIWRKEEESKTNGTTAEPVDSSAHEAWLVENIKQHHDLKVSDVMVPRADIVAVDYQISFDELLKLAIAHPHSRMPVYRETLDEVLGIIHIKDLLDTLVTKKPFDLARMIRQTKIVVPSMNILDLLLDMRLTRIHMALVVDEYGGIDGLVTIEDLLEQIVGNIEDESDLEPPRMVPLMEGAWLADGRLPLETLQEVFADALSDEDIETSDTLGGLIVALANRVPHRGEVISHPGGIDFDILEADKRRVLRVRVRTAQSEVL